MWEYKLYIAGHIGYMSENVNTHVVVLLYYPFEFESRIFQTRAKDTLLIAKIYADSLFVIYNQQLLKSKEESFDEVIKRRHTFAMTELKKICDQW